MKEEKKVVKLTDKFSLRKDTHGIILSAKYENYYPEEDKTVIGSKDFYYGTVYQALQGFLLKSVEIDTKYIDADYAGMIIGKVEEALDTIDKAKSNIQETFCLEVKEFSSFS